MGTGKEDEEKSFGWNEAKRRGKVAKQRKKIMLSRIREVIKKEIVYISYGQADRKGSTLTVSLT